MGGSFYLFFAFFSAQLTGWLFDATELVETDFNFRGVVLNRGTGTAKTPAKAPKGLFCANLDRSKLSIIWLVMPGK